MTVFWDTVQLSAQLQNIWYLILASHETLQSAFGPIIISVDVRLHGAALDRVWMELRTAAKYQNLILASRETLQSAFGPIIISVDVRLHGAALDRVRMERRWIMLFIERSRLCENVEGCAIRDNRVEERRCVNYDTDNVYTGYLCIFLFKLSTFKSCQLLVSTKSPLTAHCLTRL